MPYIVFVTTKRPSVVAARRRRVLVINSCRRGGGWFDDNGGRGAAHTAVGGVRGGINLGRGSSPRSDDHREDGSDRSSRGVPECCPSSSQLMLVSFSYKTRKDRYFTEILFEYCHGRSTKTSILNKPRPCFCSPSEARSFRSLCVPHFVPCVYHVRQGLPPCHIMIGDNRVEM